MIDGLHQSRHEKQKPKEGQTKTGYSKAQDTNKYPVVKTLVYPGRKDQLNWNGGTEC